MGRYPKLPEDLKRSLCQVEPSRVEYLQDRYMEYYPCVVTLRSGSVVDCVYVQDEMPYIKVWGVYPEQDRGKFSIKIGEVVTLAESPSRLPARFATALYQAGETRMGGQEFTVEFSDGTTEFYTGGNAVDFVGYPPGKSQRDVVAIQNGLRGVPRERPRYFWCLYS